MTDTIHTCIQQGYEAIKMTQEQKKEIKEKSDNVLKKLKKYLKDISHKQPEIFLSGSYKLNTQIQPSTGKDYDIDVAVVFNFQDDLIEEDELKTLKGNVYESLKNFTQNVKWKKPCITVEYQRGYSVDVAVYVKEDDDLYLLRGRQKETILKSNSDSKSLIKWIKNISNIQQDKYKQTIRLMKAWKETVFSKSSEGKPPSIGLTIAIGKAMSDPRYRAIDGFMLSDLIATTDYMIQQDDSIYQIPDTIDVDEEYRDTFFKMCDTQRNVFHEKLTTLNSELHKIQNGDYKGLKRQTSAIQKLFGDKFPILEDCEISQKANNKGNKYNTRGA